MVSESASASSGKLVEMQIFSLLPRPADSETLGGGPQVSVLYQTL